MITYYGSRRIITVQGVQIGFADNCKTQSCLNERKKNAALVNLKALVHLRNFSHMTPVQCHAT